jgi:hypothetical protein
MRQFVEKTKSIPIYGAYDTVVVGGGFAGIAAALAAVRGGNKVLLCEREYMLGGLGTAGLITIYLPLCDGCGHQVSFGIAEELLKLSIQDGWEAEYPKAWLEDGSFEDKCKDRYRVRYNASMCAILYEKKLLEEGVELLYGTVVCDTAVEDNRITHLIVENKSGRSAIEVGNVIDCSGDADVCHQAGESTALYTKGNILAGWYYYCDDGKFNLQMVGASDVPLDEKRRREMEQTVGTKRYTGLGGKELTEQIIDSHDATYRHFLRKGPLNDSHYLATMATIPQVRMTRGLDTGFSLDISHDKAYFEDSVGLFSNWKKRGPIYELPYRILHGRKIKNLAAAGRAISATADMWDVTRVIPVCAVTGEAVGTAAALGENFDEIDILILQKKLRDHGVKIHAEEVV